MPVIARLLRAMPPRVVRGRRRGSQSDAGMVTAETALALPAMVLLLGALLTVIVAISAQLRCTAAAREGARAAARGESPQVVSQLAARSAPAGATVTMSTSGEDITVTVRSVVTPLGLRLGRFAVSASATARAEPGELGDVAGTAVIGGPLLAVGSAAFGRGRGATPCRCSTTTSDHQRAARATERGSATLYVAACIGVLAAITAGAVALGKAHAARSQAEAAADLAALAAAQRLVDGDGDPCSAATDIAARNRARVTSCAISGETVTIDTSVAVRLSKWTLGHATARARAGPAEMPADQ